MKYLSINILKIFFVLTIVVVNANKIAEITEKKSKILACIALVNLRAEYDTNYLTTLEEVLNTKIEENKAQLFSLGITCCYVKIDLDHALDIINSKNKNQIDVFLGEYEDYFNILEFLEDLRIRDQNEVNGLIKEVQKLIVDVEKDVTV